MWNCDITWYFVMMFVMTLSTTKRKEGRVIPLSYLVALFLSLYLNYMRRVFLYFIQVSKILREINMMLLRKRSSMAVSNSNTKPTSHFATSRVLLGFSGNPSTDAGPAATPTSILENKIFSPTVNASFNDRMSRPTWHSTEMRAVGLGIIDAISNDEPEVHRKSNNSDSRMVLFGTHLQIQIPSIHPSSDSAVGWAESAGSPIEFGVKNKSSKLALVSPDLRSPMACSANMLPPSSDIELSEDYTCVIAHGPNPRTTHIFDNCIVESCGPRHSYVPSTKEKKSLACNSVDFLAFCQSCKKSLGPVKDILLNRGEKAFCSNECRQKKIFDEGFKNASSG